ncbi:F-type H+-transporting ATPase subunit a [Methylomarinovum caldicuralii]|uniref:ATP synthase subunit a n=1 Tax=Methylomarinovum caldicuralii TaxID=438856 RepID=A0AAU9BZM6_9GAMM|nr:F0F1 ATP synthase subunit A [Methylomarinovum caldicuralii]BCX81835.1 F-type H+-transporting ATPase subunit a [Methylomarinovum caldicuralii]
MEAEIFPQVLWRLGPLQLTDTLVTAVALTLVLWLAGWWLSRHLQLHPGPLQTAVEAAVLAMEDAVRDLVPRYVEQVAPFIMGLWWFLLVANLIGLIPGLQSPTRDLSITSALALLVFLSVHWFGIRAQGVRAYLRHYLQPFPFLLPFHLVSEITRTVALAVRLFGNMMSLDLVALIVLMLAGFLVPVPVLMLHVVEALVQAYIFGMLALVYIAGGIQAHEAKMLQKGETQ